MSICVCAPMRNEIRFVEAWCQNVKRYADDVVVIDTGSTDGTIGILKSHGVRVYEWPVPIPYFWDEAKIRNAFSSLTECEWMCYQDADELVGDDFISDIAELQKTRLPFIRFPQVSLWGSKDIVRVRSMRSVDEWRHWYPSNTKTKMYRRMKAQWRGGHPVNGCNPTLTAYGFGKLSGRICKNSPHPFFHYHYAFPFKENDIRKYDWTVKTVPLMYPSPREAMLL